MTTPREEVEAIERERVRSLVEADIKTADRIHADDFELINPFGGRLTKEQYLGAIALGDINYRHWIPGPIETRLFDSVAALRYESQLEIIVFGQLIPSDNYLHTDLYEEREGEWRIVWSHATKIVSTGS